MLYEKQPTPDTCWVMLRQQSKVELGNSIPKNEKSFVCYSSLLRICWHYWPSCVTLFFLPGYLDAEIPSNGSRFWSLWAGSSDQLASVLNHPLSFPNLKNSKLQELYPEHKVDVPKSNTTKIWTPIFDGHVVRCGSKTGTKKTCLQKIGLHAPNILTILG